MSELDEVREFIERIRELVPGIRISANEIAHIDHALESVYDACDMMRRKIKWDILAGGVRQFMAQKKVKTGPNFRATGSDVAEAIEGADLWVITDEDDSYRTSGFVAFQVAEDWRPSEDRED